MSDRAAQSHGCCLLLSSVLLMLMLSLRMLRPGLVCAVCEYKCRSQECTNAAGMQLHNVLCKLYDAMHMAYPRRGCMEHMVSHSESPMKMSAAGAHGRGH